jgi:hypothetical protein
MKTSSVKGFAIAAIFSYRDIAIENHKELERKIGECLDIVKKHSPDTWSAIDNASKQGKTVERNIVTTIQRADLKEDVIGKNKIEEWVRGNINYLPFTREIEYLASQVPELNRVIQELARLVDNSEVSIGLSNNLWLLGFHYYCFSSSYGETGLTTSEELCVKSLKLIDLRRLMRRRDLVDDYDGVAMTLFHLAEIYFLQGKAKQAKDFYIECVSYNKKELTLPYMIKAYERLESLGGYNARRSLLREKLVRATKFLVFAVIFFPVLVKAIEILPLFQILIVVIIILAIFKREIMRWAEGKCVRRVHKLVKKWNL